MTSSTPRLERRRRRPAAGHGRRRKRLGVQPQRGQRGAQPVDEVGGGLPLGGQQLADPAGQPVDRRRHLADLGGPVGVARALEVAGAEPVAVAAGR